MSVSASGPVGWGGAPVPTQFIRVISDPQRGRSRKATAQQSAIVLAAAATPSTGEPIGQWLDVKL